jgi:hypothetical protein
LCSPQRERSKRCHCGDTVDPCAPLGLPPRATEAEDDRNLAAAQTLGQRRRHARARNFAGEWCGRSAMRRRAGGEVWTLASTQEDGRRSRSAAYGRERRRTGAGGVGLKRLGLERRGRAELL